MRISYLAAMLVPLAMLASCGGGSGGGGGGTGDSGPQTLVPYTGMKSPALLSSANVSEITEMAIGDAEHLKSLPSMFDLSTTAMPRALKRTPTILDKGKTLALTDAWTEGGTCGGSLDITLNLNETTGAFTSAIKANGYCNDAETVDGSISLTGFLNQFGAVTRYTIDFSQVTLSGVGFNYSLAGSYEENSTGQFPVASMTMNLKDNSVQTTYRFENYVFTNKFADGGMAEEITGRFYHPAYGYVTLTTESPLVFPYGSETPSTGTTIFSGADNRKSRYRVISNAAFEISADLDADGVYDDFSSGVIHFQGRNNLPEVSAGADRIGNVGCGSIALSDAIATDVDTDSLVVAWSFASRPPASTAQLSGADTLSPSFSPDVKGEYVLLLSVSDGIGLPVTDTMTVTVYGDLFCLNKKRIIAAAPRSHPYSVAVGDVTGDGRNDVVMLTTSDNTLFSDPDQDYHLYVFAQDSTGNLQDPVYYPAGNGGALALADFNYDGRLDVAVSDRNGVGILYQNTEGLFGPMEFSPFTETVDVYEPHELIAADFSGDGRTDLVSVFSNFTEGRIRLYTQAIGGGLSTPILYTTNPAYWRPSAADADGDGDLDLFLTSSQLGKGSVYMGAFAKLLRQVSGTLGSPETYLEDKSTLFSWLNCYDAFAVGQVGSAGNVNLVASCTNDISAANPVLRRYPENSGVAGTPSIITARASYSQLVATEVTGDAIAEILGMVSGNQMEFDVYRHISSGVGEVDTYPAGMPNYDYSSHAFGIADVNGDGIPDIVSAVYIMPDGGNGILVIPGNPGGVNP